MGHKLNETLLFVYNCTYVQFEHHPNNNLIINNRIIIIIMGAMHESVYKNKTVFLFCSILHV